MPRRPASSVSRAEDPEGTFHQVDEAGGTELAHKDTQGKTSAEKNGKKDNKDKKDKKDKKEKDKREKSKSKYVGHRIEKKKRKLPTAQDDKEDEIDKLLSLDWLHEASKGPAKVAASASEVANQSSWESRLGSAASPEVFDPVMELRRKIEKLLVSSGGELTLGKAEEHLRTTLRPQVLSSFSLAPSLDGNPSNTMIRLTAKQACALLEEPSLQMAALEDSYFALGEEVMQLGLDFENEDAFRNLFDDLLAKREEVRMAAERMGFSKPYTPRSRKARRRQKDLPPMTEGEKTLLHDVRRVMKALSVHDTWIPLSQLLEDANVRRARWKLPAGLALWEWLSLRCGDQLTTVNERSDMLLQLVEDGRPEHALQMSQEERRRELSLAVFETLAVLHRDFPQGGGLSLEDLQRIPAIARLHFGRTALLQALNKMRTLQVVRKNGQVLVRLHGAPLQDPPRNGKEKPAEGPEGRERARPIPAEVTQAGEPGPRGPTKKDETPVTVSEWQKVQDKLQRAGKLFQQ